jgi:SPP1 family predicted phage head-tail adaptor
MRSGNLRRLVTLQALAGGSPRQGSSGERADAYSDFATVRAGIRMLSGRELTVAQQRNPEISVQVEMRYLAGVSAGMRISHLGVYYPVLDVRDPDLEQKRLVLDCSAGIVNPAVTL